MAPQALRRLSAPDELLVRNGELYDLGRKETLFRGPVLSDLGDLKYRPSQADDDYLEFVSNSVFLIGKEEKRPLVLGGDHLVTLFALRGLARVGRRFQVVHLDAHHDYGPIGADERPTHATFVSFLAAERLADRVIQIGVRGLSWGAPKVPPGVVSAEVSNLADALIPGMGVYLTVDTDAFDPTIAPAVQYPEPEGLLLSGLRDILAILRGKGARGVGADWTEYSPNIDCANFLTGRHVLIGLSQIVRFLSELP